MSDLVAQESRLTGVLRDRFPRAWSWQVLPPPAPQVDPLLVVVDPAGARYLLPIEMRDSVRPPQVSGILGRYPAQMGIVVADDISRESRKSLSGAGWGWIDLGTDEMNVGFGGLRLVRERPVTRRSAPKGPPSALAGAFAGTSLGIVRRVLVDPREEWTVARMATATRASASLVSRVFSRLESEGWLERRRGRYGRTRVADAWAILDAWAVAKRPEEVVEQRVSLLPVARIPSAIAQAAGEARYALTGVAAAELVAPFARFVTVDVYVKDPREWDERFQSTPVGRGGNVRLIRSADPGVFDGVWATQDGPVVVSTPQLYVDLMRQGGAAEDAAGFLRRRDALWPR